MPKSSSMIRGYTPTRSPLLRLSKSSKRCLEISDTSFKKVNANELFRIADSRDVSTLARLSDQFIASNRGILSSYDVTVDNTYDGSSIAIALRTGNKIGALPLLSPITGRPDYGLVIRPRFEWTGLGSMLSMMGWRIIPSLLRLPVVPGAENKIPQWVMSSIVLHRLQVLLDTLDKRFEFTNKDLRAPKGNVMWGIYATARIPQARFLNVPCKYPDLNANVELLSAIHYAVNKHQLSLQSQRSAGTMVIGLLELCRILLGRVAQVAPKQPTYQYMRSWYNSSFRSEVFREGIQAIEWTADDRGLAGISDLQGLPWMMSMEQFFEAWVETIAERISRVIGAEIKTGRRRETITPISWDAPYFGTQRYLLPDVLMARGDQLVIFDAKYKAHWEELKTSGWREIEDSIKETHRNDLLQILAYSSVYDLPSITCCLIYPCMPNTWASLKERGQLYRKADVHRGSKKLTLILTALPMDTLADDDLQPLIRAMNLNN